MSLNYLRDRRKVFPKTSEPGVLEGFSLKMSMEGPNFIEPSFANIVKERHESVEGVLHDISEYEMQKIINTEGEDYEVINLTVLTGKTKKKAQTLIYKTDSTTDIPPSWRYLNILIKAAQLSNLSDHYIDKLKARPYVYFPILSELYSIRVFLWVWSRSRKN